MFRTGKDDQSLSDIGELSTIKYVIVEMINNNPEVPVINAVKRGLLKGLKCKSSGKEKEQSIFILLEDGNKVIYILNTEYYNILSIERSDGASKYVTFFQAHESDQNAARDLIAYTIVKLNSEGKTLAIDSNMVDTAEYSEIPTSFGVKSNKDTSNNNNNVYVRHQYSGKQDHDEKTTNNKNTAINKDPEPKAFKRSRRPNTKTLETMREKISKIMSGELEPCIPKLDEDESVQIDKSYTNSSSASVYDEDYGSYMC